MVAFQLLPYQVEIALDETLEPALEALANCARQPVEARAIMRYRIDGHGPYAVFEQGDHLATVSSTAEIVTLIASRCQARLLDYLSLGSWVALRAGIVRVGWRRALLVGDEGAWRPVLRLMQANGHGVEGDQLVFTRRGDAVCLPWKLRTTPGDAGSDQRLECRPVDVAFVVGSGDGGPTGCRPISGGDLVRAVVANVVPLRESGRQRLRACAALVGDTDGHDLVAADVAGATDLVVAACC
jgi:hypothetical protein